MGGGGLVVAPAPVDREEVVGETGKLRVRQHRVRLVLLLSRLQYGHKLHAPLAGRNSGSEPGEKMLQLVDHVLDLVLGHHKSIHAAVIQNTLLTSSTLLTV